jgi:hypothetical protein
MSMMVTMLARMPELRQQVHSAHGTSLGGSCRECGPEISWPCELYQIAAAAHTVPDLPTPTVASALS